MDSSSHFQDFRKARGGILPHVRVHRAYELIDAGQCSLNTEAKVALADSSLRKTEHISRVDSLLLDANSILWNCDQLYQ